MAPEVRTPSYTLPAIGTKIFLQLNPQNSISKVRAPSALFPSTRLPSLGSLEDV